MMPMLPDDVHERQRNKALKILTETWIDLKDLYAPMRPLPPEILTEVISTLQDDGLVETRKAKGTIQIRKVIS